jgi:hypothetical protein
LNAVLRNIKKGFINKPTVNTADGVWYSNPYISLLITDHCVEGITGQTVGFGKLAPSLSLKTRDKKEKNQAEWGQELTFHAEATYLGWMISRTI